MWCHFYFKHFIGYLVISVGTRFKPFKIIFVVHIFFFEADLTQIVKAITYIFVLVTQGRLFNFLKGILNCDYIFFVFEKCINLGICKIDFQKHLFAGLFWCHQKVILLLIYAFSDRFNFRWIGIINITNLIFMIRNHILSFLAHFKRITFRLRILMIKLTFRLFFLWEDFLGFGW